MRLSDPGGAQRVSAIVWLRSAIHKPHNRSLAMRAQGSAAVGAALASLIGLIIYLPLLSRRYDLNGIAEAAAVEAGGRNLAPPNHMLFRVTGAMLYESLRVAGFQGRATDILQVLTTLCGAASLGLAFLTFRNLSEDSTVALIASLFLGTSWAYWVYSTDISYITPAAMFVSGALAWLTRARFKALSPSAAVGIGIFGALAILFWQANVFLHS